jgi:uncharacterized protein DUF955/chagasin family peptidase inhibitor I42
MNTREAILAGVMEAKRLHRDFGSEADVERNAGCIDVFGSIGKVGATVLFRPLEGLLGACLSVPSCGVIISTKRPLPVQRFTGAHELGHVVMHHDGSLDGDEILRDDDLDDDKEIQANAFASEFMMPKWLLGFHARRQKWDRDSMKNPRVVYQLSLRIGASYEATCISLKTHKLIEANTVANLMALPRKQIKQQLLGGFELDHWRRDVWLLTRHDEGALLQGQPEDLFLFRLDEQSGAGYLWDIHQLKEKGFTIVRDRRDLSNPDAVGGPVEREIAAKSEKASEGELLLEQRRPWQRLGSPAGQLHLRYDLQGKEQGLPRSVRRKLEAA